MEINEVGTIAERLSKLIDHFAKGNKAAFGRQADIQSGVLAGMIGGRMSKPGFEVLQKLLTAYPTVSPTWLLFGRGPMLHESEVNASRVDESSVSASGFTSESEFVRITPTQYQELIGQLAEAKTYVPQMQKLQQQMRETALYVDALLEAEETTKVYRIGTSHPGHRKLAQRLNITEEEARELVLSGKIRARYLGADNDKARRNGASYIISEQAVREFLATE